MVVRYVIFVLLLCVTFSTGNPAEDPGKVRDPKFFSFLSIIRFNHHPCSGDNYNGTCMSSTDCANLNGTNGGSCAQNFGVCCISRGSCGAVLSQNCSYFQNPGYPSSTKEGQSCEVTLKKCGDNICQIRLDFETFEIAGPDDSADANIRTRCLVDKFKAEGGSFGKITQLCGTLTGDHLYLDVPEHTSTVGRFGFSLGLDDSSTERNWNIKFSQIPCNANYRAPTGCTQYYTETKGNIHSYNFQYSGTMATGVHLAGITQNICIRPASGYCSITYTKHPDLAVAETFDVSKAADTTSSLCTQDYLILRGAVVSATLADRFCGSELPTTDPITTSVKPFKATFKTNGIEDAAEDNMDHGVKGFSLEYTQNMC